MHRWRFTSFMPASESEQANLRVVFHHLYNWLNTILSGFFICQELRRVDRWEWDYVLLPTNCIEIENNCAIRFTSFFLCVDKVLLNAGWWKKIPTLGHLGFMGAEERLNFCCIFCPYLRVYLSIYSHSFYYIVHMKLNCGRQQLSRWTLWIVHDMTQHTIAVIHA